MKGARILSRQTQQCDKMHELFNDRSLTFFWFFGFFLRLLPFLIIQVAQELTYMAVWLRIPLVHPEAMDPALNGTMGPSLNGGTTGSGDDSGGISVDDIGATLTGVKEPGGVGGGNKEGDTEVGSVGVANGEGGHDAAVKGDDGGQELAGGKGKRVEVEDPWETWNTVRVMCEHKSW